MNETNILLKDFLIYQSNLILSTNQGLPVFKQTQVLRSTKN